MKARLKTIAGHGQGDVLSLDGYDVVTIGRTRYNTIQVMERDVSRTHCRIERFGAVWRLSDADSRNGTFLNDEKISTAILKRGDQIRVGQTVFQIEMLPGAPTPRGEEGDSEVDETVDSSAAFSSSVTTEDTVSTASTPAPPLAARWPWVNPLTVFAAALLLTLAIGAAVLHFRSPAPPAQDQPLDEPSQE